MIARYICLCTAQCTCNTVQRTVTQSNASLPSLDSHSFHITSNMHSTVQMLQINQGHRAHGIAQEDISASTDSGLEIGAA